jgi:hypothetical protein
MQLALAIVFLWLGAACLVVAFHPLALQSGGTWGVGAIIRSLQSDIAAMGANTGGGANEGQAGTLGQAGGANDTFPSGPGPAGQHEIS